MSQHRTGVQDPAAAPPTTTTPHADGPAAEAATAIPMTSDPTPGPASARHTRWPMRLVVAVSVITGLAAAAAGVIVSAGGTEPVVDGLALLGFAVGWAMLAVLSVRFTDHPQRWAAVPATVMGAGGAVLLIFTPGGAALDTLGWIWPPALLGLLVWITTRIRRQLPRRGGRGILYPVIAVTALAAVGGSVHTVTQSINQASAETLPGQLIDVGDHRLFLSCTGSGEPTVILEPGLGETSAAWGLIAPTVAEHTRVCVYDRAGRGRSEPSPAAQDGDQIATDLHTLLDRAGITGPLVMAGHSLGGLYVLDYTARYPEQVAGMVLVDSTPPTAFTALPDYPAFYNIYRIATGLFPGLARLGVTELIYSSSHPELPAPAREQARAALSTAEQARSQRDEFAMVPTMMAQAGTVTTLGDRPLYVLTAPVNAQTGWLTPQIALAALSSNSIHLVVAGAGHESLLDNPADAATTIRAITTVVDAARTDTPLN
jgi:pimeloyl-ACP methyl ester carboxylesterase